jgi:hypothetical protein
LVKTNLISSKKMSIPLFAVAILIAIAGMGFFTIGFDQGHLFSIILGQESFDPLYLHELTHDMRHAAGFPCH